MNLSGSYNPAPLVNKIKSERNEVIHMQLPDHHIYSENDLKTIHHKFDKLSRKKKCILTTEKDAIKLEKLLFADSKIKNSMYYLPIKVKFLDHKQEEFDATITDYIATNKEINRLHK